MKTDPRNPPKDALIPTDSTHPFHEGIFKTLVLLSLETKDGLVYFVIEGLGTWPLSQEGKEFFYEEHQCPTNFIPVKAISYQGDMDPHGIFNFIESVWMTTEYQSLEKEGRDKKYLQEVFPQLRGGE